MNEKKINKVFIEGPVTPEFIRHSIASHSSRTDIGAHSIFLGQVRNDLIDGKEVKAIDYSAYIEMAEEKFHEIREETFQKYSLTCMHIYHSIGKVNAGEISLFVFVSSVHRNMAFDACRKIVERIKKEVPVWGKEIFEDESFEWKTNS